MPLPGRGRSTHVTMSVRALLASGLCRGESSLGAAAGVVTLLRTLAATAGGPGSGLPPKAGRPPLGAFCPGHRPGTAPGEVGTHREQHRGRKAASIPRRRRSLHLWLRPPALCRGCLPSRELQWILLRAARWMGEDQSTLSGFHGREPERAAGRRRVCRAGKQSSSHAQHGQGIAH